MISITIVLICAVVLLVALNKKNKAEALIVNKVTLDNIKSISISIEDSPKEVQIKRKYKDLLTIMLDKHFVFLKPELKNEAIDFFNTIMNDSFTKIDKDSEVIKYAVISKVQYDIFNKAQSYLKHGGRKTKAIAEFLNDNDVTLDTDILHYVTNIMNPFSTIYAFEELSLKLSDRLSTELLSAA